MYRSSSWLAIACCTGLFGTAAAADPPASGAAAATPPPPATLAQAIAAGKAKLSLRLRVESVDEDPFAKDASAVTLRTRLAWQSADFRGFALNLEADDIHALDEDSYNSTANGVTTRPVIGDPVGTEINVAALTWKNKSLAVTAGRQRLVLDNQRFIGNVGWRQNEQTYDGVTLKFKPVARLELTAGGLWNVNRVFGPRTGTQLADWHGNVKLLNAKIDAGKIGSLSLFGYAMDFDNAAAVSNATWGAALNGSPELSGGWKLTYALSFASQSDAGDNPTDYTAGYRQLEVGLAKGPYALRIGQEVLEGDATLANHRFQTPLATLHAFQGWADKFLTTPPQGVEDSYVAAAATVRGTALKLEWHDFRAEAVSRSYGSEWNASIGRTFAKRYEVLAKFADYQADGFATDTTKWWLMFTAAF
ncbi:MAG: hypothetical protein U1E73_14465 [Planctomycetota bacterium]